MQRVLERMTGPVEFIGGAAVEIANTCECFPHLIHAGPDTGQSVQDRLSGGAMSAEMGAALWSYVIELSHTFLLGARLTDLFKKGQSRVDHAGTWAVKAVRALFDHLDKFVAVTRALFEERQNHELQIGRT